MSIRVTHVRLSVGGTLHEHITHVRWTNYENGSSGTSARADLVDWIDSKDGRAFVETATSKVQVGVVRPSGGMPYLRTHANGQWTDNLLALPRF